MLPLLSLIKFNVLAFDIEHHFDFLDHICILYTTLILQFKKQFDVQRSNHKSIFMHPLFLVNLQVLVFYSTHYFLFSPPVSAFLIHNVHPK